MPRFIIINCLLVTLMLAGTVYAQEDEDALALNETYTSATTALSFDYPTGWTIAQRPSLVAIVSNQDILSTNQIPEGEVGAFLYLPDAITAQVETGANVDNALETVLGLFTQDLLSGNAVVLGEPTTPEDAERAMLQQYFDTPNGASAVLVVALPENNYMAFSIGLASAEALETFMPVFVRIADSLSYTTTTATIPEPEPAPELDAEALTLADPYVSDNFGLSLRPPEDWVAAETASLVSIVNMEDAVDEDGNLAEGAVQMVLIPPLLPNDYSQALQLGPEADVSQLLYQYVQLFVEIDIQTAVGPLYSLEIGDLPVARQRVSNAMGEQIYYMVKLPDQRIMIFIIGAALDALNDEILATAEAVIASIDLDMANPPSQDESDT
ncbi:MAG: hypothetical protein ACLFTK_01665 [Anaerolineales bacterium]